MRRFTPSLSRAIALAMVGLTLVVSSSVALAAGLTVGLATPTADTQLCDVFGCLLTTSGNLSGSTPGTYTLQLTLDPPPDFSGPGITQLCFGPTSGEINQAILNFTGVGATGQVVLSTGALCAPADLTEDLTKPLPIRKFSIPFTVQSGNGDFLGATGSGTLDGQFPGSIIGGHTLSFLTVNSPDFNVPSSTCTDPNGCNNPPPPGATPELDSLLLFGSGLSGVVAYALRRRRAGKLPS